MTDAEFDVLVAEAAGGGLRALSRVAEDDLDRSEVSDVLATNVLAAVADADCTRLTVLVRLQAQLVGQPFGEALQDAIDACFANRDADAVSAFRAALDR